jgi:hypothetical protein
MYLYDALYMRGYITWGKNYALRTISCPSESKETYNYEGCQIKLTCKALG